LSRCDLDRDLDLDVKKKSVSTVEIFSTSFKNWSRRPKVSIFVEISIEISISTPKKSQSRPSRKSRQVLKTGLDAMAVLDLDLDWSRRRDPQAYFLLSFLTCDLLKNSFGLLIVDLLKVDLLSPDPHS
jgi:hypothetical protein